MARDRSYMRTPEYRKKMSEALKGKNAKHYSIGQRRISAGEEWIFTENGWKRYYRWIIEQRLGRPLTRKEIIHHKDFNRLNNSEDNLIGPITQKEHMVYHKQQHSKDISELWKTERYRKAQKDAWHSEKRKNSMASEAYRAKMSESLINSWNRKRLEKENNT